MTEREMPHVGAFPFGGMTNVSDSAFAPPSVSEPESPVNESSILRASQPDFAEAPPLSEPPAAAALPSRRDMRAAGAYAAAVAQGVAPIASSAAASAAAASPDSFDSTQAMSVDDIVSELASPVAPLVISQAPIAPIPPRSETVAAPAAPPSTPHLAAAPTRPRRSANARRRPAVKSARPAARGKSLRQRLTGTGVMVLVAGLFTVLALPAYANNDASTLAASTSVRTQDLTVSESAATTATSSIERDGYTATSATALKSIYADALRQQNLQLYLQSGAKEDGDDYPWYAELSRSQGGGLSPLGYYYRECVDFVAWRLNRDAGSTQAPFKWTWSKLTPNGGDGHQWKAAWLAHGWPTGTTPVPGSVAWFGNNHVGYVNGILSDGQVLIEEYNYKPHAYSTRVINPGDAYYLYAPPAS